jgi:hypothetical protein
LLPSHSDNEIRPLELKGDIPTEEPMTVTDTDPVMTKSKKADDATFGASTENTRDIVDA